MKKRNYKDYKILVEKGIKRTKYDLMEFIVRRRFTLPYELKTSYRLSEALNCIKKRWPGLMCSSEDTERPVFIFSAGWRSGSTLLQRLVISSGEILIWGEPLGEAAFIPKIGSSLSLISSNWPHDNYFFDNSDMKKLNNQWIANLTPEIRYIKDSNRSMIKEWLGKSAEEKFGVERWGLKEVRLTIDHAKYLKWLFPSARFLFIYRNPIDAYKSWKGNRWRSVWPGYYSRSPVAFSRHWKLLIKGFLESYKEVDGYLVKFEDLILGNIELQKIADHIKVKELDSSILEKKIGAPDSIKSHRKKRLTLYDRIVISTCCGHLMKKLGYKIGSTGTDVVK